MSHFDLDPSMVAAAQRLTADLRTNPQPPWDALCQRLESEGVEPSDAAVGLLYADDVKLEMGLIRAIDGRTFEFTLEFWYDEAGNEVASPDEAWISEWRTLDETKLSGREQEISAVALAVLRPERNH